MKKECNIVQDLLLGYIDEVVSEDSKEVIEEHIKTCNNCKEKLEDIQKDIKESKKSEEREVDYLKNVKKKISKKNMFIIIIGLILSLIIIFNIIVFVNYSVTACEMEIFLNDDITEENQRKIVKIIKEKDSNAEIIYHSKQEALEQMKEKLKGKSYLLNQYEDNNIFPASYTIKVNLQVIKQIKDSLEKMSGVRKITSYVESNPYEVLLSRIFYN